MDIIRSFDHIFLEEVMEPFMQDAIGFEPKKLINDTRNILLFDGSDNFSLFEHEQEGEYFGHYLFGSARGKRAVDTAKTMLRYIFKQHLAKRVYGRVPLEYPQVAVLTQKLGFIKDYEEETEAGPMMVYVLTKEGFFNNE